MIKIELTDEEAENFKVFMEYREDIAVLIREGFFIFKGGHQAYHRDESGRLRLLDTRKRLDKDS